MNPPEAATVLLVVVVVVAVVVVGVEDRIIKEGDDDDDTERKDLGRKATETWRVVGCWNFRSIRACCFLEVENADTILVDF
jgi:hypothetical protein